MSCPHKGDGHGETREVECPGCFNVFITFRKKLGVTQETLLMRVCIFRVNN